jgi:hypothetical protein
MWVICININKTLPSPIVVHNSGQISLRKKKNLKQMKTKYPSVLIQALHAFGDILWRRNFALPSIFISPNSLLALTK